MQRPPPIDPSLITEERLRIVAHMLKHTSWRRAIVHVWGTENAPMKWQLRDYVKHTYGNVGRFRTYFGA